MARCVSEWGCSNGDRAGKFTIKRRLIGDSGINNPALLGKFELPLNRYGTLTFIPEIYSVWRRGGFVISGLLSEADRVATMKAFQDNERTEWTVTGDTIKYSSDFNNIDGKMNRRMVADLNV